MQQLQQAEQGGQDKGEPEHQVDLLVDHIDGEGADARGLRVRSTDTKNLHLTCNHSWKSLQGQNSNAKLRELRTDEDMKAPCPGLDEAQKS